MTSREALEAPFLHQALLYADDDEYLAGIVPFVEEGLAAGEPVLVAVPQARLELLREALPTEHPWVQMVDMGAIGRNPARIIPAWADFARPLLATGRSVRGIGEPLWPGRSDEELTECQWHETLINMAFADATGFTLLCPYDTVGLGRTVIDEAHGTHPEIGRPHGIAASPCYETEIPACPTSPLPPVPAGATWVCFEHPGFPELRQQVHDAASAAGLAQPRVEDVVVAVNEAAVNAVQHGGGGGRVGMWSDAGSFCCEIRDAGRIHDPLAGRRRPRLDQIGGRGLWMITQLCDLVQIRWLDEGQAIRLHVDMQV